MAAVGPQRVVCPPDRHISANGLDILEVLEEKLPGVSKAQFEELWKLTEATSQFEYLEVRRRLKKNFELFSASSRPVTHRKGKALANEEELDRAELCFVEDFYTMLKAAQFRLLSQDDWTTALEEDFTFTMPVEVTWDGMDTALLKRFWEAHPEERATLADISDRVIFFHRGITQARAKGRYIADKIDLLVNYIVVQPAVSAWMKITRKQQIQVKPTGAIIQEANVNPTKKGEEDEFEDAVEDVGGVEPPADPSLEHVNAKVVERMTLARLYPTAWSVIKGITQEVELREPMFKDIVLLYRRDASALTKAKTEKDVIRKENPGALRRNINIKSFADVPMADCEVIFPEKKVHYKPIVLIQLAITLITAVAAAIGMFMGESALDIGLVFSVVAMAGGRAMQVWTYAQREKQAVHDAMTTRLYDSTLDAQAGVVTMLLDEMGDQHLKELLLAYFILLAHGGTMTEQELDEACETWLEKEFGLKLDFAIEASLPTLLQDKLVTADESGQLKAADIDAAITALNYKWDHYFEYMASGQSTLPGLKSVTSFFKKPTLGAKGAVGSVSQGVRSLGTGLTSGISGVSSFVGLTRARSSKQTSEPTTLPMPNEGGSSGGGPMGGSDRTPPRPQTSAMSPPSLGTPPGPGDSAAKEKKKKSLLKRLLGYSSSPKRIKAP